MNPEDIREFLAICLMCGDGVPTHTDDGNPDLVAQYFRSRTTGWRMFGYCRDGGLLSDAVLNSSGIEVHYVTQKGKDLLI